MSLTHVVLFKFDRQEQAVECVERIKGMAGGIPGLRTLEAGVNVVPSERAYDVALVATFDSVAGLRAYSAHPVHQPVAAWVREHATSTAAVDFES